LIVTKQLKKSKFLNDQMDRAGWVSDIDLMSVADQLRQVHCGDWAACADLTAGFYQFPYAPSVVPFFCFNDEDSVPWDFNRLVMGFKPAAQLDGVRALSHTAWYSYSSCDLQRRGVMLIAHHHGGSRASATRDG